MPIKSFKKLPKSIRKKFIRLSTKPIPSLVLFLILFAFFISIYIYVVTLTRTDKFTNKIIFPTITPTIKHEKPISFYKQKKIILRKTEHGKSNTKFSIVDKEEYYYPAISQWQNWLFFDEIDGNGYFQIKGYNLNTDQTLIIYNQDNYRNQYPGKDLPLEISDLQVIDNQLFFSLGGYLIQGAFFGLDLPPGGLPQKLTDSNNARISFWKNRYWIVGGEGDACWGSSDYSMLNLDTKTVTRIATSNSGCAEGEEYVTVDKSNRFIMAFHTAGQSMGENDENIRGIYQYVIGIPLSNPSIKEGIIAKQNMPTDIKKIEYLEETNQLLLTGKDKYTFNLSTNILTKTDQVFPTPIYYSYTNKTWKTEDIIKQLDLPLGYEFVLE